MRRKDNIMTKYFIPCLYIYKGKAVTGFGQKNLFGSGNLSELSLFYSDHGADRLLVFDFSSSDTEHDRSIACIKNICKSKRASVFSSDAPFLYADYSLLISPADSSTQAGRKPHLTAFRVEATLHQAAE